MGRLSAAGIRLTMDTAVGTAPGMTHTGITTDGLVLSAFTTEADGTTVGVAIMITGTVRIMDGIPTTVASATMEVVTGITTAIQEPSLL